MINDIFARMIAALDPEIKAVGRIIKKDAELQGALGGECDAIFHQRLQKNPQALKMSFWEEHFEWKSLRDYPEINGRILDFGCGSGHSDILLARTGYKVHGVDLSSTGIRIANYLRQKERKEVQDNLGFSVADVTNDFPETELYDAIWSSHVFEHISDPCPVLKGLRRWARPGANLLISVPYGNAYDDSSHVNHFHCSEDLADFLEGFVTVQRIDLSHQFKVLRALCCFRD